jgi:hypothetical protein
MDRRKALVLALALALVAATACTPPPPLWLPVPVPPLPAADLTQPAGGSLDRVSCPTPTFCLTVGRAPAGAAFEDGQWRQVPLPAEWTTNTTVVSLSCGSPRSCLVAEYSSRSLWHWDGTSWSALPDSDLGGQVAIDCVAERDCLVVDQPETGRTRHWHGGVLTPLDAPRPPGTSTDLWCASPTWCLAVGAVGVGTGAVAAAARWDGTARHDVSPPAEPGTRLSELDCQAVDRCVAAGTHQPPDGDPATSQSRLLRWTAAGWQPIDTSALPIDDPTALACLESGTTACLVTGFHYTAERRTVVVVNVGDTAATVDPQPVPDTEPLDLACAPAPGCIAVGRGGRDNGFPRALQRRGPVWEPAPATTYATAVVGAELTRVSCATSQVCVAVGRDAPTGANPPLGTSFVMRWDGRAWTRVVDPDLPGRAGRLVGVSCPTPTFCVLAGGVTQADGQTVPRLWVGDGRSWSVTAIEAGGADLTAVSCASASFCVAVGPDHALRWDGTAWTSILPAPEPTDDQWLHRNRAVSCGAPDRCVSTAAGPAGEFSHVDRWDGTRWTRVWQNHGGTVAAPEFGDDQVVSLQDVACVRDDCVAVGFDMYTPFALRGRGTTWSRDVVPAAVPALPLWLTSVSCAPDGTCAAIAKVPPIHMGQPPTYVARTRLTGPWSAPTPGPDLNLTAVSCVTGACVAVGGRPDLPEYTTVVPTSALLW